MIRAFHKLKGSVLFESIFGLKPSVRFSTVFQPDTEQKQLVFEKIMDILRNSPKCDKSKLTQKAKFTDLGFDSLDVVELIVAFEESLGYDLPSEVAESPFTTVEDALTAFAKHRPIKE